MTHRLLVPLALVLVSGCGADDDPSVDAATSSRVRATVSYQGSAQGALVLAAFTSFPPAGAPAGFAQQVSPSFPASLTIEDLEPGTFHVLALLDVAPASPQQPGPEDITGWQMNVAADAGALAEVSITLQDP